ncbi:enoyl-CoA hydratase/isomerase family protein [Ramlibacter sp. XY19]|uniref:enoyl-CoA hydratase/isomerase family protein n=1 Tax=Ramlibacter paludis TaxID=2908000 RepID=UPI0023DA50BD|nr:enoyl-CoA hydratase/isomerase family protein [Ramlibacter paludis]MCG2592732.1 enoyl-CoA hydratase/isomerase family protein [Ramlibacter paludis]
MSETHVHLVIDKGIARVTFDRPEARNAMTWQMYERLHSICERLREDPTVRVACFRGAGGQAFVAGTDIAQFQSFTGGESGIAYERGIDAGVALLESLPFPTVAVVEGWAVGGGLAIATACDFRIATPGTKFGAPIARTLGNCLSMANIARLVAAFGRPRAERLLLLAEMVTAEEAQACGYVLKVAPAEAITDEAQQLCERLAALAPVTQRVSKEALNRLLRHGLPDIEDLIRTSYGSEDFHEGVQAFVAKRAPVWKGR